MKLEVTDKEALEMLSKRHFKSYTMKLMLWLVVTVVLLLFIVFLTDGITDDWVQAVIIVTGAIPYFVYVCVVSARADKKAKVELKALKENEPK